MTASLVKDIASFKEGDNLYDASQFATRMLILHEATHVGDRKTNNGLITNGEPNSMGIQNTRSFSAHRGTDVGNAIIGLDISTERLSNIDWQFSRSDLRTIKDKLSSKYNPDFKNIGKYFKQYNSTINSFKNTNPTQSKVIYE